MSSPHELRYAVETLRELSPRLNSLTDLANETVRDVEQFLNDECRVGVPARVTVDEFSKIHEAPVWLAYRRVGPRYRIAIVFDDAAGNEVEVKPWTDCPRALKLKSICVIPTLLAELAVSVEQEIARVESATLEIAEAVAALRHEDIARSASQVRTKSRKGKPQVEPQPEPQPEEDLGGRIPF